MLKGLKGKGQKAWSWMKANKGKIIGGVIVAGAAAGAAYFATKDEVVDEVLVCLPQVPTEEDFGRDMTMRFSFNDTGEVLGDVQCSESYANDMIEIGRSDEEA